MAHQKNADTTLLWTREELARRIAEAEAKGEMPDEATVLIETKAIIIFGNAFQRRAAAKQWLQEQRQFMEPKAHQTLVDKGYAHTIMKMRQSPMDMTLHTIHEKDDIHMTNEARERLFKKQKEQEDVQQNNGGRENRERPRT